MTEETIMGILDDYCGCIFEVVDYDSIITDLSQKTKRFCVQYCKHFGELDGFVTSNYITQIQIRIKRSYNKYVMDKIKEQENPFEHYSYSVLREYLKQLKEYCSREYQIAKLPNFFHVVMELIALELQEFQSTAMYINTSSSDVEASLSAQMQSIEQEYRLAMQKHLNEVELEIDALRDKIKKTEKKSMELNITILGIFSAVVLAFSGMFTFSTSVLQSINSASIYRIVFVSLIIGLILFNLIFCLFYYLNCLRDNDKKTHKTRSLKPMIITDVIILFLLFCTFHMWNAKCVENRNKTHADYNQGQYVGVEETAEKAVEEQ